VDSICFDAHNLTFAFSVEGDVTVTQSVSSFFSVMIFFKKTDRE